MKRAWIERTGLELRGEEVRLVEFRCRFCGATEFIDPNDEATLAKFAADHIHDEATYIFKRNELIELIRSTIEATCRPTDTLAVAKFQRIIGALGLDLEDIKSIGGAIDPPI